MADVEIIRLTRGELRDLKQDLNSHVEGCCGAQDGTCRALEQLGEVQFLLSKPAATDA